MYVTYTEPVRRQGRGAHAAGGGPVIFRGGGVVQAVQQGKGSDFC